MRRPRQNLESTCCPFINRDDPRCAELFTLARMEEAFGLCLGDFRACPTYHELRKRRALSEGATHFGEDGIRAAG